MMQIWVFVLLAIKAHSVMISMPLPVLPVLRDRPLRVLGAVHVLVRKLLLLYPFIFLSFESKTPICQKIFFVNQMLPVHLGKSTSGSKRAANCVSLVSKIILFSFKIKKWITLSAQWAIELYQYMSVLLFFESNSRC